MGRALTGVIRGLTLNLGFTRDLYVEKVISTVGAGGAVAAKEILNEISIMHACNSVTVVEFYGAWLDPESHNVHIVMEYMNAGCLDSLISRVGRLEEPVLAGITQHVLMGLDYLLSDAKVVHRDIKPSNVLISTAGHVKLCDFGTSRILANTMRETLKMCTFVGTIGYMAPERLVDRGYTAASDVWSLGISLVECATGYFPFPIPDPAPPLAEIRYPRDPKYSGPHRREAQSYAVFDLLPEIDSPDALELPHLDASKALFSGEFIDLVGSMLRKEPRERISVRDALKHRWVSSMACSATSLEQFFRDSVPLDLLDDGEEEEVLSEEEELCVRDEALVDRRPGN